jgi:hypothetical protein
MLVLETAKGESTTYKNYGKLTEKSKAHPGLLCYW